MKLFPFSLMMFLLITSCVKVNSSQLNQDEDNPPDQDNPLVQEENIEKQKLVLQEYALSDLLSPSTIASTSAAQRLQLITDTINHPVANLGRLGHYDPQGLTGFCFGRAMAAHILARQMGIHSTSIKKQFIVGDLKRSANGPTEWRFHVTTLVKGQDDLGAEQWFAIDPIFDEVMTQEEWIEKTRGLWDQWWRQHPDYNEGQSHIYVVPRHNVLPDIRNFVAIDQESGENLIETKFRPDNRPGFTQNESLGYKAYDVNSIAADKYFLSAMEDVETNRFNFVGLQFEDGFYIDYNDYFRDLLKEQQGPPLEPLAHNAGDNRDNITGIEVSDVDPFEHVSMDFEKIQSEKALRSSQENDLNDGSGKAL